MSGRYRDGLDNPDGMPVMPEGTNGPPPERAQRNVVRTRNAILAALNLPDLPGLPALDTLVTAVLGQRAQDRAFWLSHYFLVFYFIAHQLFRVFPCSSSAQLDALREFALEVAVEVEQEQAKERQP